MEYTVLIDEVEEQPLAVVRRHANHETLSAALADALEENAVYLWLETRGISEYGRSTVLYWDEEDRDLLMSEAGLILEIGVAVPEPIDGEGDIEASATPYGEVARTVHMGDYEHLGAAHAAVRTWCKANQRAIAGPNWEIYGDWAEDPAERRTDVLYLLK
jgi:effector-binding domain-containing protein